MTHIIDPSKQCMPGDILHGKNNRNKRGLTPHYIIFLGSIPSNPDCFLGAMLTSSSDYSNIPLHVNHFDKADAQGNPWQVTYKHSFIVDELFFKKNDWRPFTKVGQLSTDGLLFVEKHLKDKNPVFSQLNEK